MKNGEGTNKGTHVYSICSYSLLVIVVRGKVSNKDLAKVFQIHGEKVRGIERGRTTFKSFFFFTSDYLEITMYGSSFSFFLPFSCQTRRWWSSHSTSIFFLPISNLRQKIDNIHQDQSTLSKTIRIMISKETYNAINRRNHYLPKRLYYRHHREAWC